MTIQHYVLNNAVAPLFSSLRLMLTDVHFCIINSSSLWWEPIVWKQLRKMNPVARGVKLWFYTVWLVSWEETSASKQTRRDITVEKVYGCWRGAERSLNFNNFFNAASNQEVVSVQTPRQYFPHTYCSWYLYFGFRVLEDTSQCLTQDNTDMDLYCIFPSRSWHFCYRTICLK